MKRIYKYRLNVEGQVTEVQDKFSRILTIQTQNGWPHVWIEIDDIAEEKKIVFAAIGTGWEMPDHDLTYAGTAQDMNGFVWHYYYSIEEVE